MLHTPTLVLLAATTLWGSCAVAQQGSTPPPPPPKQDEDPSASGLTKMESAYRFRFDQSLWYVGLSGDVRLPGAPVSAIDPKLSQIGADKPRLAPMGEVRVNFDPWRVSFSAFGVSVNTTGIAARAGQVGSFAFGAGATVKSSIDLFSAQLLGGYSFGNWSTPKKPDGKVAFSIDQSLIAGLRMYDLSMGFGPTSTSTARSDQFFIEPVVGGRIDMELNHGFSIEVESTVGYLPGDRGSMSWEICAGFVYRPIENLGIRCAYRNMRFDLHSGKDVDKFDFNGGGAGLLVGLELRF